MFIRPIAGNNIDIFFRKGINMGNVYRAHIVDNYCCLVSLILNGCPKFVALYQTKLKQLLLFSKFSLYWASYT